MLMATSDLKFYNAELGVFLCGGLLVIHNGGKEHAGLLPLYPPPLESYFICSHKSLQALGLIQG